MNYLIKLNQTNILLTFIIQSYLPHIIQTYCIMYQSKVIWKSMGLSVVSQEALGNTVNKRKKQLLKKMKDLSCQREIV